MSRYNKLFILIQIVRVVNIWPMMNKYDLKKKQVGNMILVIFYVISYSSSLSLRQTSS